MGSCSWLKKFFGTIGEDIDQFISTFEEYAASENYEGFMKAASFRLNMRGQAAEHFLTEEWQNVYDYNAMKKELISQFSPKPEKIIKKQNNAQNPIEESSETHRLRIKLNIAQKQLDNLIKAQNEQEKETEGQNDFGNVNTNKTFEQKQESENDGRIYNVIHQAERIKHKIPGEIQYSRRKHGASGADRHNRVKENSEIETEDEFKKRMDATNDRLDRATKKLKKFPKLKR